MPDGHGEKREGNGEKERKREREKRKPRVTFQDFFKIRLFARAVSSAIFQSARIEHVSLP